MFRTVAAMLVLIVLSACGGGGASAPSAGEVAGRVVDDRHRPVVGVTVRIQGVATTTDVEGRFSVPDVTRPYTVMLADNNDAVVFVGLTRSAPTLEARLGGIGAFTHASLDGSVSGGVGFPQPVNHKTVVHLTSDTAFGGAVGNTLNGVDDTYALTMHWAGPPSAIAQIDALQFAFDPVTKMPTSYTGFGGTSLTATGSMYANLSTPLLPIPTNMFSGAISLPAGFSGSVKLRIRRGRSLGATLFQASAPAAFAYPIPGIAALSTELYVIAGGPIGSSFASIRTSSEGSANHVAVLPIPTEITAPQSGALNVDHTVSFTAAAVPDRIYAFDFRPSISGMNMGFGPSFTVYTAQPTATIPDLAALGIALPSDQPYVATVRTLSPFGSLDAATGTGGLSFARVDVHYETHSRTVKFQTAQ